MARMCTVSVLLYPSNPPKSISGGVGGHFRLSGRNATNVQSGSPEIVAGSRGHAAVLRGCDVDKPRNLAKSVTVE